MKTIKILSVLLVLVICATTLLVSCGSNNTISKTISIADIMNKSWTADNSGSKLINSYKEIETKGDYYKDTGIFVITSEADAAAEGYQEKYTRRIYNTVTGNEIASLTNSTKYETISSDYNYEQFYTYVENYFSAINDNYIAVLNIERVDNYSYDRNYTAYTSNNFGCYMYDFNEDEEGVNDSYVKYTLTVYDAKGTKVKTINHEQIKKLCTNDIYNFDYSYASYSKIYNTLIDEYLDETEGGTTYSKSGLIVKGTKVYKQVKDGDPTLIKDFGLTKAPYFDFLVAYGDFYLESYNRTYTVYDKDLNKIFDYSAPYYEGGSSQITSSCLLADGSLLIQYIKQLDQNANDFDLRYDADQKFDLVTLIVNKDEAKELANVNFYIANLVPALKKLDGQSYYADTVENIAKIYFIGADKMLDIGDANSKIVTFSNKGEIVAEVVANDYKITSAPTPINDDLFSVSIIGGGTMLFNDNGEVQSVLASLNKNMLNNKYIVIDNDGIYDLNGEKKYDFKKNSATYTNMGDALFINSISNGNPESSIFNDGKLTTVSGTVVEVSTNGYYVVENETKENNTTKKTYTYFNVNGTSIGTFENKLSLLASSDDCLIFSGYEYDNAQNKTITKVYRFSFAK